MTRLALLTVWFACASVASGQERRPVVPDHPQGAVERQAGLGGGLLCTSSAEQDCGGSCLFGRPLWDRPPQRPLLANEDRRDLLPEWAVESIDLGAAWLRAQLEPQEESATAQRVEPEDLRRNDWAVLALSSIGGTLTATPSNDALRSAVSRVEGLQDRDTGRIGTTTMQEHSVSLLALAEAQVHSPSPIRKKKVEKAVGWLLADGPEGGLELDREQRESAARWTALALARARTAKIRRMGKVGIVSDWADAILGRVGEGDRRRTAPDPRRRSDRDDSRLSALLARDPGSPITRVDIAAAIAVRFELDAEPRETEHRGLSTADVEDLRDRLAGTVVWPALWPPQSLQEVEALVFAAFADSRLVWDDRPSVLQPFTLLEDTRHRGQVLDAVPALGSWVAFDLEGFDNVELTSAMTIVLGSTLRPSVGPRGELVDPDELPPGQQPNTWY
ncbi:MAG: hypothetical protein AAFZ65_07510 [Planctomycetota bacterium]